MTHSFTCRMSGLLASSFWLVLLAGCVAGTAEKSPSGASATAGPDQVQQSSEQQARERQKHQREQERQRQRRARINNLLDAADAAHADNRLTLPAHDNAYDRYAAVLLLDPGNNEAETGLQSILLSYAELIRSALRDRRVDRARQLFDQVREYYQGNPLLDNLRQQIEQVQEQSRLQLIRISENDLEGETFPLPAAELSRKGPEIRRFLVKVAQRVRDTDESVLIVARTDAEGRWIYQQMKEAVPDYRVRGDIRLASTPELRLLPPL